MKHFTFLGFALLSCFLLPAQSTVPVWSTVYNANTPATIYNVMDFAVDSAGNSFVVSVVDDTTSSSPNLRQLLIKYDPNGALVWTDTILNTDTYARIAIGRSGFIYVATSRYDTGSVSFLIRKLNSTGGRIWTKKYGPAQSNQGGRVYSFALDSFENIYLCGDNDNSANAVMLKCDSSGTVIWNNTFSRFVNGYDRANAIDFDRNGNSYVAVMSQDSTGYPDLVLLKYSATGQLIWQQQVGGPGYDWPKFLQVYHDTSIYVGGDVSSGSASDFWFLNCDSAGQVRWSQVFDPQAYYNFPYNASDQSLAMLVTHNGTVIMTGSCFQGTGAPRQINVAYDPYGNLAWVSRDFRAAEGYSISEDRNGNIIFSGDATDTTLYYVSGIGLSKYDSLGHRLWSTIYVTSLNEDYFYNLSGVDYQGNIYCSAQDVFWTSCQLRTVKFDYTVNIEETTMGIGVTSFPNPFTDEVEFMLSGNDLIDQFALYDCTGKLVIEETKILSSEFLLNRGNIEAGIYIYKIKTTSGKISEGKLIAQ